MRTFPALVLAMVIVWCCGVLRPQAFAGEAVATGDSYQTVLKKKGTPTSYIKSGRNELLFYGATIIELMDGEVVAVDGRKPLPPRDPAPAARNGEEKGKGPTAGADPPRRIIDVRQQGKAIDIRQYLVPGAFTVVAFYADW
ncbi:MAG: hypothetical protein AB1568_11070 [Thermodesulfobacteriota bacterium]